jgi:uncharacterized membrane protein (DUF2068 family)
MAEVYFSLWLISQIRGQDAQLLERRFKFLIHQGFKRYPWNFDRMLEQAKKDMKPKEFEYATALALAYLDESKVPQLEQYDRWRALAPLDPKAEAVKGSVLEL